MFVCVRECFSHINNYISKLSNLVYVGEKEDLFIYFLYIWMSEKEKEDREK